VAQHLWQLPYTAVRELCACDMCAACMAGRHKPDVGLLISASCHAHKKPHSLHPHCPSRTDDGWPPLPMFKRLCMLPPALLLHHMRLALPCLAQPPSHRVCMPCVCRQERIREADPPPLIPINPLPSCHDDLYIAGRSCVNFLYSPNNSAIVQVGLTEQRPRYCSVSEQHQHAVMQKSAFAARMRSV
jgi:hypothetical protein